MSYGQFIMKTNQYFTRHSRPDRESSKKRIKKSLCICSFLFLCFFLLSLFSLLSFVVVPLPSSSPSSSCTGTPHTKGGTLLWYFQTKVPLSSYYFLYRQKVTKKRCAPIIRPLRCAPGFPHSGLAPGRTALQAPSWGPALDGHPCPSPPSARPAFGLLKSRRSRSRLKSRSRAGTVWAVQCSFDLIFLLTVLVANSA